MTQDTIRSSATARPEPVSKQNDPFGGGVLWIGEHEGDHDILVMDPAVSDPNADVLALYSLTQHRMRRFPRAMAADRIHPITDQLAHARAKKEYSQRVSLRDAHERTLETAQADRMDRIREGILLAHRQFVENRGLTYQGVDTVAADARPPRASRCYVCDIAVDGFVGVTCRLCSGTLCSCGACVCGKPPRGRRATADRET
jgi:hypothetical protein